MGPLFKAHRLVYHSTLGVRVIQKKKKKKKKKRAGRDPPLLSRDSARHPEPLHRNVLWYRGGLVFEAHRLWYHSA